jgi:hypothetical protein
MYSTKNCKQRKIFQLISFSNFSCMFLNPNNFNPIWILIVLIYQIWETSRNMLKKHVNLCQKLLFLHQLTHSMTTDCSLNYKFNTWKFQAQTWGEHVVYRICLWHSEQFLYTTCSPHVLQKEELLTKIYL